MDDTPTTLLVAERDERTRAFLLDKLAADGYEPLGAQTDEETRVKLRHHGPALLALSRPRSRPPRLAAHPCLASCPTPSTPVPQKSDGVAGGCDESEWVPGLYGNPRDPRDRATGTAGREAAAGGARSAGHVTGRTGRTGGAELSRSGGSRPLGRLSLFTGRTRRVVVPRVRSASVAPAAGPCRAARADSVGRWQRLAIALRSREDAHRRRPRLPAAPEAGAGGRTAPDPQHTGSRLPALARLGPGAGRAAGGLAQRPCGVAGASAGAVGCADGRGPSGGRRCGVLPRSAAGLSAQPRRRSGARSQGALAGVGPQTGIGVER
jgi:hypothetical protein